MKVGSLDRGQIFIDCGANDGVYEAQGLPRNQHREVDEADGQAVGDVGHPFRPVLRTSQVAPVRQGPPPTEPGQMPAGEGDSRVAAPPSAIRSGATWPTASGSILLAGLPPRRNSPRSSTSRKGLPPVASLHARHSSALAFSPMFGPDQLPHRGLAQRLGTKYGRARFQQQRSQEGRCISAPARTVERNDDRQTGQPIREVQQEAQGWFVGPLGVVDRKINGPRSVMLTTSQYRPCSVANATSPCVLGRGDLGEHRFGEPRRTGQQSSALGARSPREEWLRAIGERLRSRIPARVPLRVRPAQ